MLEPLDKLLLITILLIIVLYYSNKVFSYIRVNRYKKKARRNDLAIMDTLEEQGYIVIDVCSPKKVEYYKDSTSQIDFIDSKLVVRGKGKKYLVEKYSQSQTISLRDNLIKLKILTNIAFYNINGVLFVNPKGMAIKECTMNIVKERIIFSVIKKIALLAIFTTLGFYLSKIFL